MIQEMRDKQSNLLWPQTLKNSRGIDGFLVRGSPNPTLVQRIAAWLIGLPFLVGGLATLSFNRVRESWF
jgi:hypothetical protein